MVNSVLGFDFGTKRIGVAIGQLITHQASPLNTLKAKQGEPNWQDVDKLLKTWQPDALIVGIPLNMDGTSQDITEKAKWFQSELENRYQLPTYGVDERLTTVEARQLLFDNGGYKALKNAAVDSLAAVVITEQWMKKYVKPSAHDR